MEKKNEVVKTTADGSPATWCTSYKDAVFENLGDVRNQGLI